MPERVIADFVSVIYPGSSTRPTRWLRNLSLARTPLPRTRTRREHPPGPQPSASKQRKFGNLTGHHAAPLVCFSRMTSS